MPLTDSVIKTLSDDCESIVSMKALKADLEKKISAAELRIKNVFHDNELEDETIGHFHIHIRKNPPSQIVDTAKLKAAGLFESYSKTRAGSESLLITENE